MAQMGTHARTSVALAAVLLGGLATAQVKKGEKPPEFTFGKVWNDGPKSFAELAGKVVIVEYSHSKHEVCKQSVPHFNELHKKFAARGLIVLGVSSEPEATIQDQFVTGMRAVYPWVKSNDFAEKWKIEYLPSCYCIDAFGNLHSLADWWVPDEATIEELLQALPLPPKLPPEKLYDPLRPLWARSDFARLREHLEKLLAMPKLEAAAREVLLGQKQALEERQQRWLERATQLGARPDYASAASELERIEKWHDGRVKLLVVIAVGLRPKDLAHAPVLRGLGAHGFAAPLDTVFPAVTCTVQASFLTGLQPSRARRRRQRLVLPRARAGDAVAAAATSWCTARSSTRAPRSASARAPRSCSGGGTCTRRTSRGR
jgi:hypothetical protein